MVKISEDSKSRSNRIGIKWKMFALLIMFTVLAMFVIWICGVQMLSHFYQRTKFNEFKFSNASVVSSLGDDQRTFKTVGDCADEYDVDIWVYLIKGDSAYMIACANGTGDATVTFIDSHMLSMYEMANKNDGNYIAIVPMEEFERNLEMHVISDNMGAPNSFPPYRNHSTALSALGMSVHEVNGERYAVFQAMNLTPVSAMVKTLKNQFLWIGILLTILVLIFAEVMSKLITKPFIKMNRAAKELAKGHYDVEFTGKGYREINELADALNYAAGELSQSDSLKKELISNVSHDLRTPLTMIKGYSEVMRDIPGENTPENVQVIIDETERLTDLVNDMLDLSKIQSGTQRPEMEIFSLTDTVRTVMQRYEKLIGQDGYRIEFFADNNVDVCADRGMILQVIYNLINNAIHYTGDDKLVYVRQTVNGDTVRISVTDSGEGISAELIPMIWERYYKVDKVHKRARVGTGLGLSIVKGVLELHHATYGVESALGKGSTFWFDLTTVTAELVDQ